MTAAEALDELYGLALAEFTAARNASARALKEAGDAAGAEEVGAAQKPNQAAWALNQLVRGDRVRIDGFLALATELREAQLAGGDDLAQRTRALRGALDELVEAAAGLGAQSAGAAARAGVRQSLEAAAVDDDSAERLLEGRLVRELEPAGFGSLAAHAPKRPPAQRSRPAKTRMKSRAAREEAQARVEQARKELTAAERSERDVRRALDAAAARSAEAAKALEEAVAALEASH